MKVNIKRCLKLTQKERKILDKTYNILNKLDNQIGLEIEEDSLPVLMSEEDAKLIGKVGDLATDIFEGSQSILCDYVYYDK